MLSFKSGRAFVFGCSGALVRPRLFLGALILSNVSKNVVRSVSRNVVIGSIQETIAEKFAAIAKLFELDYKFGVTEGSGVVTDWNDKTDNGFNFTTLSSADRPTLITEGILFQNDNLRATGNPISGKTCSIFLLYEDNTIPQSYGSLFGTMGGISGESLHVGPRDATRYWFGIGQSSFNVDYANFDYVPSGKTLLRFDINATNKEIYFNDVLTATITDATLLSGNQDLTIGMGNNTGPFNEIDDATIFNFLAVENCTEEQKSIISTHLLG